MEDKILVTRPSMPPFEEYVNEIKSLWDSALDYKYGNISSAVRRKIKELS